jgi:hypothetical protein
VAMLEERLARSHHLNRLRCGQRLSIERSEPCANATARERAAGPRERNQPARDSSSARHIARTAAIAALSACTGIETGLHSPLSGSLKTLDAHRKDSDQEALLRVHRHSRLDFKRATGLPLAKGPGPLRRT